MLYILRESKKSTYIFTCIPIHTYALYRDTYINTYMHTYVHIDMPTAPIRFTLPFDSARAGARRNIDWLLAYFVVTQANALFEIRYWEKVRKYILYKRQIWNGNRNRNRNSNGKRSIRETKKRKEVTHSGESFGHTNQNHFWHAKSNCDQNK